MRKQLIACLVSLVYFTGNAHAQQGYSNNAQQSSRVAALAKKYPQLVQAKSIAKTAGGKDIWMLTLGTGNTAQKPAIAVLGGIEGNLPLTTELAIGFAEKLLQQGGDSVRQLLDKTTYYIFPNLSPDAMEQYFASLKYERQGNATTTDADRDGKFDEDGYEDLNGDGKISWIRVTSPIGNYKLHPDDSSVLIKADLSKGDKGQYLLYSEGIDDDHDGKLNEDGPGGVWFNKNFTYKYEPFSEGSGEFPVSEIENRALLDTLFELFNVYAVVSFGSYNNLSTAVNYNAGQAKQRIVAGWQEEDVAMNKMVSGLYNKATGLKDAPKTSSSDGDCWSWAYFHYGRYSFSTPGWWVPKAKPDTAKKEKPLSDDDATANYLRWARQQGINNTFTSWKPVQHPDFPGQTVEVGGIDPFVLTTPPYNMVSGLVEKHTDFLVKLAAMQPAIDIINIKTEKVNNDLTRITLEVVNKGALASHSKIGERSYWIKRVTVKVLPTGKQSVISGRQNQSLSSLEGYSSEKLTWLIKGSGKISIQAGSPTTGTKQVEISL